VDDEDAQVPLTKQKRVYPPHSASTRSCTRVTLTRRNLRVRERVSSPASSLCILSISSVTLNAVVMNSIFRYFHDHELLAVRLCCRSFRQLSKIKVYATRVCHVIANLSRRCSG
jgi:hypothetical protein